MLNVLREKTFMLNSDKKVPSLLIVKNSMSSNKLRILCQISKFNVIVNVIAISIDFRTNKEMFFVSFVETNMMSGR